MKMLLERRHSEPNAVMAFEMFCYHVRKQIGSLSAVLGRLDLLVFTGGIGERSPVIRWAVCRASSALGSPSIVRKIMRTLILSAPSALRVWSARFKPTRI